MDCEFLTESRFNILQEIAKGKTSASEIAKSTKISLPYILNQLILLEAKGFISKEDKVRDKTPGRPKQRFKIKKSMTSITLLRPGEAARFPLKENSLLENFLQLTSHFPSKYQNAFSVYYWSHIEFFKHVTALALITIGDNKLELVAFTTQDHLTLLRKEISNEKVSDENKLKLTVACWVHTPEEFSKGLKENDTYYTGLHKKMKFIMDTKEVMSKLS